jgi:hypothetical protein
MSRSSKVVVALVVAALLAVIALKPVGVFGWDADSLSSSLARELGDDFGSAECVETQSGDWTGSWHCRVETDPGSGFSAAYRAFPGDNGCWTAQDAGDDSYPGRLPSVSGCVGLLDLIDAVGRAGLVR